MSSLHPCLQEGKKQFDKETERYYSVLEKHLSLSSKKKESHLNEVNCMPPKNVQFLQQLFGNKRYQMGAVFVFIAGGFTDE